MTIALVVTTMLLPTTPPSGRSSSLGEPLRALRYPGVLTVPLTALFSNMGFFTLLAITSVLTAPWLQRRFGTIASVKGALILFMLDLAGAFLGVNNTLITEAVMGSAPVDRPVASSAYSFVRFSGGAVAPWAAGRLGEEVGMSAPFWMAATAVLIGVAIFTYGARYLREQAPTPHSPAEGQAVLVGDAD